MTELTPRQLSALLDISVERAVSMFFKHGFILEKDMDVDDIKNDWRVSITNLEKSTNLNLNLLIEGIRANTTKNQEVMERITKDVIRKVKPNKETGFFPKTIKLPYILQLCMNEEERAKVVEGVLSIMPNECYQNIKKFDIKII